MVITRTIQTEKIEKQGEPNLLGIKSCKTYRKALQTLIGQYYKKGNTELEFHTRGLLELYNKFHPEKSIEVEIKKWKGKSTFEIIDKIDKIIVIKYQKPSKEEEPKRTETEITKEEINKLIYVIKNLSKYKKEIKTSEIAMYFSYEMNLNHKSWRDFFSDRYWHNKLNIMFNVLKELNLINYSGGISVWLDNKLSFQENLNSFTTIK